MNKKIYFAAMATMVMCLGSCDKSDEGNGSVPEYISVSTQITDMSRVTTGENGAQSFQDGDKISVYAWTGDKNTAPAPEKRVVNNSINTLSGSAWSATPQMLWQDTQTEHYFIGIYPSETAAIDDLSNGEYTLDVSNQEASDLLVAVNTQGIKSSGNPVPLIFNHIMAKLVVNLSFRNQWGGQAPTVQKVTVSNASTQAAVNYLTQTATASTTAKGDVSLPENEQNHAYASIFIPQQGVNKITITIDGTAYTYTHQADIALEKGKYTTVNLIVGRDEITLGSVSISDWQEGNSLNGEAVD